MQNADLEKLGPEQAVDFIRDLLLAEARRIGLPASKITVSVRVDVPDGGIDASIDEQKIHSSFIHPGHSGYQIKAGRFKPWRDAEIRKTLFGTNREPRKENLGASVRDCLDQKGTYVLVCTKVDLTPEQRRRSVEHLRKHFRACGYRKAKVEVWGQGQSIGFLQQFPSLRLRANGRDHLRFQTHKSWSQQEDMQRAFRSGPRQSAIIDTIRSALRTDGRPVHLRILGDPGVGKTRLLLEAVGADDLKSLVIYCATASTFRDSDLMNLLLRDDNDFIAILVVDECSPDDRAYIWNRLRGRGDRIKLITIHSESEATAGDTQYIDAPSLEKPQIAAIFQEYGVPPEHTDRWAEFCGGSPRMAHMVGWNLQFNPTDLLKEPDTTNVWDRFIVGRDKPDAELVRQRRTVLRHLALFKRFGHSGRGLEAEARTVANIIQEADPNITWARFQESIKDLRERRILQGEATLYITPKLLHIKLWVEYWETYGAGFQIEAFIKRLPEQLQEWFFEIFAYAAESRAAIKIVEDFLGPGGLFHRSGFIDHPLGARFFRALSEAHPRAALECLKRTIGTWDRERLLHFKDGRRYVVWALQGIAVWRELFPDAARLLLLLGEAENETWANNASGVFAELFSPGSGRVAPTEAPPGERFPVMREALASNSSEKRALALKAADRALESQHFSRAVGPEYQGLRVVPKLWTPETWGELLDAYRRVWGLLAERIETLPHEEQQEAISILLEHTRSLARYQNLLDMVIGTLSDLSRRTYVDPKRLIEAIERILHYEGKTLPEEARRRWRELRDSLVGNDYHSLMQRYVGMDILEDKFDERGNVIEDKTGSILTELSRTSIRQPEVLDAELRWLVTGAARNGYRFGYSLGRMDSGFSLLPRLLQAQRNKGDDGNAFFLGGYFRAIREVDTELWEAKLDGFAADVQLRGSLPEVTWRSGILTDRAAERVVTLAERGLVPISDLHMFAFGSVTKELSEVVFHRWIEFLLRVGNLEAISIALELFHFYYDRRERTRQLPKELTAKLLMAPALFRKGESRARHDRINWEWAQVAKGFVRSYPDVAPKLAELMLEHFGEDGTIVEGFHSQPQRILEEVMKQRPREMWRSITKYLGPPTDARAYHITSWLRGEFLEGQAPGIIADVPLDELWRWVDEDVEERAAYLAGFVPKTLSRAESQVSLARELLIKYGDRDDVRGSLIANLFTEGWSGPESSHHQRKREQLLEFRRGETNPNVHRFIDEYVRALDEQIARAKVSEERRGF